MRKDWSIKHEDISKAGYYFLNKEQEEMLLSKLNDELACRVGESLLEQLLLAEDVQVKELPIYEIQRYFEKQLPGLEETIGAIREEVISELEEKKEWILMAGMEH